MKRREFIGAMAGAAAAAAAIPAVATADITQSLGAYLAPTGASSFGTKLEALGRDGKWIEVKAVKSLSFGPIISVDGIDYR